MKIDLTEEEAGEILSLLDLLVKGYGLGADGKVAELVVKYHKLLVEAAVKAKEEDK